jgi:hypothetical protein
MSLVALKLKGALPLGSVFTMVLAPASAISTCNGRACRSVKDMDVAGEFGIAGLEPKPVSQVYVIIIDEEFGDGGEGDVPCEPPIVEPVDAD